MDRASGSGVFARDPDALMDLIELEPGENVYKQLKNNAACQFCISYLDKNYPGWQEDVSQDDMLSQREMVDYCKKRIPKGKYGVFDTMLNHAREEVEKISAWRIEGTLREFSKFSPVNLWFDYPVHKVDKSGVLNDIQPDDMKPQWQKAKEARKTPEDKKKERMKSLEFAYEALKIEGEVTIKALEEYFTLSTNAIRKRVDEHPDFTRKGGAVFKNE